MEGGISIPASAKSCRNATAVLVRTFKTSCTSTHSRAPSACDTDAAIPICGSPFRQAPLCTDHNGRLPPSSFPLAHRTIITQHAIIPRGAFARSTVQCSTVSRHHPPHYHRFYRALGQRVKQLRKKKGYTQEDMISFGFGLRHWQQIEGCRPLNISTILRICDAFDLPACQILTGLDDGFPRSQLH